MNSKYVVIFTLTIGLLVSLSNTYSLEEVTVKRPLDSVINISKNNSSIWDQLRANFNLKHYHGNAEVISQRNRYLNSNYELDVIIKRSTPYLYLINQEIKKRKLPAELVLLPLVESNYDPHARSHKSAAGLWQIIPSTGQNLGLVQNRWYDGRHDIYTSTKAALAHLAYLNKKFNGDWLITLAAYNAGEGAIGRVIERNRAAGKPTDYWSLHIPYLETRLYVQRFLALVDIIENADEYDFKLPAIPNRPTLTLVEFTKQTNLHHTAKITGMNLEEIYKYNPGIKRTVNTTPPNGPHHLLLPVAKVQSQKIAMLQKTPETSLQSKTETEHVGPAKPINYHVKQGDSLKKIANDNDTTIKQLLAWNDHIEDPALLIPGQVLTLYG